MINRDFILKTFFNKINLLKRQGNKELKLTYDEANDLSLCISELLADYYSKTYDVIEKINNLTFDEGELSLDAGFMKKD